MADFLFYLFATLTVVSAALVVVHKNAINAAMCFLLSLIGLAGLFVLLDAALLAFVLLLVYAGAVASLFLFIIMLLDTRREARRPFRLMTVVAATLGGALLLVCGASLFARAHLPAAPAGWLDAECCFGWFMLASRSAVLASFNVRGRPPRRLSFCPT